MCNHWLTLAVGDRKPLKPDFSFERDLRGWSAEEGLRWVGLKALPESRTEMMVAWLQVLTVRMGRSKKVKEYCRSAERKNKQALAISG